jgi:hypothetical protein
MDRSAGEVDPAFFLSSRGGETSQFKKPFGCMLVALRNDRPDIVRTHRMDLKMKL